MIVQIREIKERVKYMNDQNPTKPDGECSDDSIDFFLDKEKEECRQIENLTGSPALAKACFDEFDYAMKLRTGEVIYFSSANVINKEWVHLHLKPMDEQPKANRIAYPAERGVDVRMSDIVWVMDAPLGS